MGESSKRAARQASNLARHLNETYGDTLLFLARHGLGRSAASAAELAGIDDEGVDLVVHDAEGTSTHRLPFPEGERGDARSQVGRLLMAVRATAPPEEPQTSLEKTMASRSSGLHGRMAGRHKPAGD